MKNILVVGAGLSGATIAEHYSRNGVPVTVIDKRTHIGGNVYDEIDSISGIRISKYGAHLFHTNDEGVWAYVQRFAEWCRWDHKVIADISGLLVPIPVNRTTINLLFNKHFSSEEDVRVWLADEKECYKEILNSRDVAISRVGLRLYKMLFEAYTQKQWDKDASELEPSVLERIPVKYTTDEYYFSDKYQALPKEGYTAMVKQMLKSPLITLKLNTDWEDVKGGKWDTIIFTGPIDVYFKESNLPPLEYRSIQFHWEHHKTPGYYQGNSVVNYPDKNIPYTRCVEYKHFLNQKSDWTVIAKEVTCAEGEPYYPVPNETNRNLYRQYVELAEKAENVHFVGRLANYKYFNMDQAIRNSIDYYNKYLAYRP